MRFARHVVVKDIYEWHAWFAWYPVCTRHYWVWLERVERKRVASAFGPKWTYL